MPLPTVVPTLPPCDPSLPLQPCAPTGTTALPVPSTPCSGVGCLPQPGATTPPPTGPGTGAPDQGEEPQDECGITDIGACVTEAIDTFFRGFVIEALNPLLDLLSATLLTTPVPGALPRLGELWDNSWQILLVCYGLLVLIAGIIAMGYQSVQTRHSVKELAPRLVFGFLAGALSLWVAGTGIEIANALVAAIMGGGVDVSTAGRALRELVLGSVHGGLWIVFTGLVLAGMLIALLLTYMVRVALTIVLIAGAPVALMFHALPQTEGIAYWWWKAYGACLGIQLGQSLTLITAIKVFLTPGGFALFGPTTSGSTNLLVALALVYILFKIPSWMLSSIWGGGSRGVIGSMVRAFVAYKTFGLLGGRGGGKGSKPRPPGGGRGGGGRPGGGSSDPYASPRTAAGGQYVLPLPGVRRARPAPKPKSAPSPKSSARQGRQLALPLREDWPENKPVLGRDGQYQLPLDVQRTTPPPASPAAETGARRPARKGRQPQLPFDPYQGNRATRTGQYPLPLDGVRRMPPPTAPSPPAAPRPRGRRVVQPELPFDSYQGNRATRDGQYPLPLDGVRRVPPPKPTPVPPPAAPLPSVPRTGRQLRLPLDLPTPPKAPPTPASAPPPPPPPPRRSPRKPKPGGKSS
ncbi:Basic proline-rich protein precursor [Actinokineospora spheciospongiae]|uniref:Basic proline-rich protein n=1 Tax=Actinokineospora spheciospongiae TaxID=909613 RepID=W7J651_9PSEU|nr:Basic proline-rich protein precursor [Actinokineospora spheciospongiae]